MIDLTMMIVRIVTRVNMRCISQAFVFVAAAAAAAAMRVPTVTAACMRVSVIVIRVIVERVMR